MDWCGIKEEEEKHVLDFGGETCGKRSNGKTESCMGG